VSSGGGKGEKTVKNAWACDNGGRRNGACFVLYAKGTFGADIGGTADTCGIFVFNRVGGMAFENCCFAACRSFQKNTFFFYEKQ
jgi:hypothetical protein